METLYYVRSDSLGVDPEIGTRLAQSFWNTFHERVDGTPTIALANRGVFLALDDSPVLEGLRRLADKGCRILVCGSCMDFYGVRERMAVGEPGSIPLLQQAMNDAAKVVTF
jgi:Ni,Fe-hydrogenase I small subunit